MTEQRLALENLINEICQKCNGDVCRTKNNGACKFFRNYKTVETALKAFEKPAVYVARNRGTTKAMIEALKNAPAVKVTCLSDENKADAFDILKKFLIVGYDMTNRDKPSLTFSIRTGTDETYMFYSTTDEKIIQTFRRAFE